MTFQLANLRGQSVPPVTEHPLADDEAFTKGALVLLNSGEVVECAGDPTVVFGVSLTGAGPRDAGDYTRIPTREFPPGFVQIQEAQPNIRFSCEFVGDLDAATEGVLYGVVKGSDGLWRADLTDTGHDVVRLISKAWHDMLRYDFVDESVETEVVKGSNRIIVEFVTPQYS